MTSKINEELFLKASKSVERGFKYTDSDMVARLHANIDKRLNDEVRVRLAKKMKKLQEHEARLRRDEHYAKFYEMADRNFPEAYGERENDIRHSVCVGHGVASINFASKVNQMLHRFHKANPEETYKNFVLTLAKHPSRIGGGNFHKLVKMNKLENSIEYLLVTHFKDEVPPAIYDLCKKALNSVN